MQNQLCVCVVCMTLISCRGLAQQVSSFIRESQCVEYLSHTICAMAPHNGGPRDLTHSLRCWITGSLPQLHSSAADNLYVLHGASIFS